MKQLGASRNPLLALAALAVAITVACRGPAEGGATAGAPSDAATGGGQSTYSMGILYFAPEEGADSVFRGLFEGLEAEGLEEGGNLEVKRSHAQGEIANIPMLVQDFDSQDLDVIVTLTTPCLTAACAMARRTPVVFTYVYDPIAAGAGTTATDHLPHVTGVGSFPPVEDTVAVIQRLIPGVASVGTVYNSSEANSRKVVEVARGVFAARGIELKEATVTNTSELYQAAQAVVSRGIEALWITGDNTALQGFDGLVKVARDARLPMIINDPEFVDRGALAAVGLGWYQAGLAVAPIVASVMRGESPRDIPFQEVAVKQLVLNHEVAATLGITFPADIEQEAAAAAAPAPAAAESL